MPKRPAIFRPLVLTVLLAAGSLLALQPQPADAQQSGARKAPAFAPGTLNARPRGGGYSMTLSDIWGLPEMPPQPKDFGPHFDFPGGGYNLNGPPDRAPYPN